LIAATPPERLLLTWWSIGLHSVSSLQRAQPDCCCCTLDDRYRCQHQGTEGRSAGLQIPFGAETRRRPPSSGAGAGGRGSAVIRGEGGHGLAICVRQQAAEQLGHNRKEPGGDVRYRLPDFPLWCQQMIDNIREESELLPPKHQVHRSCRSKAQQPYWLEAIRERSAPAACAVAALWVTCDPGRAGQASEAVVPPGDLPCPVRSARLLPISSG
jgi:hypothetical protein